MPRNPAPEENANPVTRYLDRRRTERGGTWIAACLRLPSPRTPSMYTYIYIYE